MSGPVKLQCNDGATIGAWHCPVDGAPRGAVVIVQEIFGVTGHIRDVTAAFAAAGYEALAPAFFDRIEAGVDLVYDRAGYARGRALAGKVDMGRAVADVAVAARWLAARSQVGQTGQVAVVGYCWGGTVAFVSGLRLGLPMVSYYGSRNVHYLGEKATAAQQFHFGERDTSIPHETVARHRELYPQAEIWTYPAGHGFNCNPRKDYHPASAKLARERTLAFLARNMAAAS